MSHRSLSFNTLIDALTL